MLPSDEMPSLYMSPEYIDHLIGEDEHGALVVWPCKTKGYIKRTPFTGSEHKLVEVDRENARGTGWPGGPRGRAPRSTTRVTVRVSDEELAAWERAARN